MSRLRNALCWPLMAPLALSDQRALIEADVARWDEVLEVHGMLPLLRLREFRNLYLHRLAHGNKAAWLLGRLLMCVYRREATLHIVTTAIGPGLFIQHGFATIIAAESIGRNCWINQQVTIGFKDRTHGPVLEDEVTVAAGAKVIGDVTLGRDSTVGANAVVIEDVPASHTAVGVPARYIPKPSIRARVAQDARAPES
jgi:serine O-acetyltransferase